MMSAQQQDKKLNFTIIGKQNTDFGKILGFQQGKTKQKKKFHKKWYTLDGVNRLYYTQLGNKKIQNAFNKKLDSVELINQDLNLSIPTHRLQFENKAMKHLQSGAVFSIKQYPDKITFNLNGQQKSIPDQQFKKLKKKGFWIQKYVDCNLSIGLYKIQFAKMKQTNLFSKFQRSLRYQQIEEKIQSNYELQVNYNINTCRLSLEYVQGNPTSISKAIQYIKEELRKSVVRVEKQFDELFTRQLLNQFLSVANQENISIIQSKNRESVMFEAYNEKKIINLTKIIQHSAKAFKISRNEVIYPKQWSVQTKKIQTFIVPSNTNQFGIVQASFTKGKILQLVRLQNQYVYKRFYEQKMFLKQLNEGKQVKQMKLYHGTSSIDPKIIYEDKQECFNINYTGQTNLLGKGIYFAQKPQYSVRYSFCENPSTKVYSMFYCCVLVGQSQKCPAHNNQIKDTSLRDTVKKIKYQSMTDFLHGSNVFVVYKSKRAYPLYLIKFQK